MLVDLHNHTILCNHAKGSTNEYVQAAIKAGTSYFGFSDHAPMNFSQKYRMSFDQMDMYEKDIHSLKERYKDQIDILLAYEVDFLEGYMDERVLNADVDYLIGSVHFIKKWEFDNPEFIGEYKNRDINQIWQEYFDTIEEMAKQNLFDIVGHIDLIKIFKYMPTKDIRIIAQNAIKAIKKADMVVELNTAGYRKPIGEAYPSSDILELLSDFNIPITFGSDAHDPSQIALRSNEIENLAKRFGYRECAIFKQRERQMINF